MNPVKSRASKKKSHKKGPVGSMEAKEQPQTGHLRADFKRRFLHSGHRQGKGTSDFKIGRF
jgi:hypothetical protein